jgi:hypothetical protein
MSTSNNGNDPKGKSVMTTITNNSPWVLIVENCQVDYFVTSYLLRGHNVQGIYIYVIMDFYFCCGKKSLKGYLSQTYCTCCHAKKIQKYLHSPIAFLLFGFIRFNLK